jgi:hypothetical protein
MPNDSLHAAAVSLGHRGGIKGGPARARALSPSRRSAIARHAANVGWSNQGRISECLSDQDSIQATDDDPGDTGLIDRDGELFIL